MRGCCIVFLLFYLVSCNFSVSKGKRQETTHVDSAIDFAKVDASPYFKECESITLEEKNQCFGEKIQKEIAKNVSKVKFVVHKDIQETVFVHLLIDTLGTIRLKEVEKNAIVSQQLPALDSLLKLSVQQLPKAIPATKQGVFVTTQYTIPIQIQIKE